MQKKVFLIGFVVLIVVLLIALFFYKKSSVNLAPLGVQATLVTPKKHLLNQRNEEYSLGITDQTGGFTEFSGTVVSVNNDSKDKSITLNLADGGNVMNIKLSFPLDVNQTLLYKAIFGKMESNQIWEIVDIDKTLKDIVPESQVLIYIRKPKNELMQEINKSGYSIPSVGPIEKLAVYVK